MNFIKQGGGKLAAGQAGLIGYHHHRDIMLIESADGLPYTRQENKSVDMVDIAHLLVDGAITVQEYCGLFYHVGNKLRVINEGIPLRDNM